MPSEADCAQHARIIERAYAGRLSFDNFVVMVSLHVLPKSKSGPAAARAITDSFQVHTLRVCRLRVFSHTKQMQDMCTLLY